MSYDAEKPFPKVGDRIREDYGPASIATWKHAGVVLAVLDKGQCIVVRRWCGRRGHQRFPRLCRWIRAKRWRMGSI